MVVSSTFFTGWTSQTLSCGCIYLTTGRSCDCIINYSCNLWVMNSDWWKICSVGFLALTPSSLDQMFTNIASPCTLEHYYIRISFSILDSPEFFYPNSWKVFYLATLFHPWGLDRLCKAKLVLILLLHIRATSAASIADWWEIMAKVTLRSKEAISTV